MGQIFQAIDYRYCTSRQNIRLVTEKNNDERERKRKEGDKEKANDMDKGKNLLSPTNTIEEKEKENTLLVAS